MNNKIILNWKNYIKSFIVFIKSQDIRKIIKELIFFLKFFLLVIMFLIYDLMKFIWYVLKHLPLMKKIFTFFAVKLSVSYKKILTFVNHKSEGEISSLDIIFLANRHLKVKKNRTIITVGGMAIGFGSVIFLLSLGYGIQKMVVNRVARLNELKQIDVTIGQASSLKINNDIISQINSIEGVKQSIPIISTVSKVEYNNSVSDSVVYGVERLYLEESSLQLINGKLFEDGELTSQIENITSGVVAGAESERFLGAKMFKQRSQVNYSIHPLVWKPVYSSPSTKSSIIGHTKRDSNVNNGIELWGELYKSHLDLPIGVDYFGNEFNPWISDSFLIWKKEVCNEKLIDCVEGNYVVSRLGTTQEMAEGYITEDDVSFDRFNVSADSAITAQEGEKLDDVEFFLNKKNYIAVFSQTTVSSQENQLFTTHLIDGKPYRGELVFGQKYSDVGGWGSIAENSNGEKMGLWIRAKLPLWRKLDCVDCESLYLTEQDSAGKQVESFLFIKASDSLIEELEKPPRIGSVLGDATTSAELVSSESSDLQLYSASESSDLGQTDSLITLADGTIISTLMSESGSMDWVTISSDSALANTENMQMASFNSDEKISVLVNKAFLNVLGISENDALGVNFQASIKLDNDFFEGDYFIETETSDFVIIGVLPEEKLSAFYMPFNQLKSLGVDNYSQLKVLVEDENDVEEIRKNIESMGFRTSSVVDTVNSINSLFGVVRFLLLILGMVALSIASLGMFNTLTVSLLEKTREVGLMKTIGMKSNEVKRLFLAESIILGILGGFFGVIVGFLAGHILSLLVSVVAIGRGQGYLVLVSIPLVLVLGIITLAFLVGVATGLYPSHRATKISALNALRYE